MAPSTLRATPAKPKTPVKQTPVATESPGNWKHPRLAEITRRQGKTSFSEKNIKTIAYNTGALALLWVLGVAVKQNVPSGLLTAQLKTYVAWAYALLQAIPLLNIIVALLPLARRPDDLSDIPLTPAQRKLLGLPPSSAPPTPNSAYSTPPRYSRTPSQAGSAASNKSYTSSPLSGHGSPASDRRINGSPYSPASTLLQKVVTGGNRGGRRPSFGSPSPLGASTAASLFGDSPGSPSPTAGKRSSVGLNNKWLYEKGRRTSNNAFLH